MFHQVVGVLGALIMTQAAAQFSLYPTIDPTTLADAFNISSGCLAALNTTVQCDQTLLTMAGAVDNYLWDIDNVTALCAQDCLSSAQDWYRTVYSNCTDDILTFSGKQIPAYTVPGRTLDGLNIACLTPTTNISTDAGVAASILTAYNETNSTDDGTSTSKRQSSTSGYCLIDSYDCVGSDIIRPDCSLSANQNEPQCLDPTNVTDYNQRISNLYSNDLLCSTCFINTFFLRLASPYLPDLDYSDYLVEQYYDIIEVCANNQMPDLIIRLTPDYSDAPGYFNGQPVNSTLQPFIDGSTAILPDATTTDNGTDSNATCTGQTLTYSQLNEVATTFGNSGSSNFCDASSAAFTVTSGDLYQAFGNYGCDISDANDTTATWCVPKGCSIYSVSVDSTWYGTPKVAHGQQERGGGDGSSTGNQTVTGAGNPVVSVAAGGSAPSPTQSGIVSDCVLYSNASAGDTCYIFEQEHHITAAEFYLWNSVLGDAGAYCSTQFWSGYWYGIGIEASQPTPSATPTSVSSGQAAPTPTQSGIVSNCDKYAKTSSGDTCAGFAADQGIGTAQLYTWNTQLGAQGQNCSTEFWAGYYYCVDAPTTTSVTSSPTSTAFFEAASGDTCSGFAQENQISADQLYEWNTQLGLDGQNCSTQFWAGYYSLHSSNTPNGVCQFTGGARAGSCSKASGILDYQEIADIVSQNKLTPKWDKTAAVKYITWDSDQWVSYDDSDTFAQKRDFANSRCLGGLMVWAVDQVN
ncbi:hypothetical protein EJ03DRAFT_345213 [Teratosphaeria nubilosa]|uniref:LysM domain-containing protein n=1 Tax=Teratosphaeria nubilosa TaxID=161662 RepID=A0A6G1L0R5_9PEZI|nr:hypothetical protein EJ03DRAFT_345213 [Teratosphaeria nubilosa]